MSGSVEWAETDNPEIYPEKGDVFLVSLPLVHGGRIGQLYVLNDAGEFDAFIASLPDGCMVEPFNPEIGYERGSGTAPTMG